MPVSSCFYSEPKKIYNIIFDDFFGILCVSISFNIVFDKLEVFLELVLVLENYFKVLNLNSLVGITF